MPTGSGRSSPVSLECRLTSTPRAQRTGAAGVSGEEVVLGRPDFLAQLMDTAPPVRWVQSTWAGVTPLIQHAYRDYVLTGVKGIFGQQMSEYVLTICSLMRRDCASAGRVSSPDSGIIESVAVFATKRWALWVPAQSVQQSRSLAQR